MCRRVEASTNSSFQNVILLLFFCLFFFLLFFFEVQHKTSEITQQSQIGSNDGRQSVVSSANAELCGVSLVKLGCFYYF